MLMGRGHIKQETHCHATPTGTALQCGTSSLPKHAAHTQSGVGSLRWALTTGWRFKQLQHTTLCPELVCHACVHVARCAGVCTKPACCCFLQVWPKTHKLKGNDYYYSSLPARYKLWQDLGVKASSTPLSNISPAWLAAYRSAQAATRHHRQLQKVPP